MGIVYIHSNVGDGYTGKYDAYKDMMQVVVYDGKKHSFPSDPGKIWVDDDDPNILCWSYSFGWDASKSKGYQLKVKCLDLRMRNKKWMTQYDPIRTNYFVDVC